MIEKTKQMRLSSPCPETISSPLLHRPHNHDWHYCHLFVTDVKQTLQGVKGAVQTHLQTPQWNESQNQIFLLSPGWRLFPQPSVGKAEKFASAFFEKRLRSCYGLHYSRPWVGQRGKRRRGPTCPGAVWTPLYKQGQTQRWAPGGIVVGLPSSWLNYL